MELHGASAGSVDIEPDAYVCQLVMYVTRKSIHTLHLETNQYAYSVVMTVFTADNLCFIMEGFDL